MKPAHLTIAVSRNLSDKFPELTVIDPGYTANNLPTVGKPCDVTIILVDGSLSRADLHWFENLSRTLNPFFVDNVEDAQTIVDTFIGLES